MTRIGLLSDTHSYLDASILDYFEQCDEIWHAGDIGDLAVTDNLAEFRPLRAVFGNIDDYQARLDFPKDQIFELEGLKVWMTHIGGYPGRYARGIRERMEEIQPGLFICGHSHILKVMRDEQHGLIHINPGACGHHGFHKMRTVVRFSLENGKVKDLEVIELGRRGRIPES